MTGTLDGDPPDRLTVTNDHSELARVGAWVNAWAQHYDIPARTARRLDLCCAEIVTNIMTHGYPDRALQDIYLRLRRQGEGIALEIQDDGSAFDPRQAEAPQPAASLEEANIGGWGIHIVRRLTDELRYHRSAGRNHLTLIFLLPPP